MKQYLLIIFGLVSLNLAGKANKYPVSNIPEALTENAKAIVRSEEIHFSIDADFNAVETEKGVITVMNKNGFNQAVLVHYYDQFHKVTSITGTIYDGHGNKIERIKNAEIEDYSAFSGFSLYQDNRVKVYEPNVRVYPFTIEYEVVTKYKGLFNFPSWRVFKGYNVAVEKSSFTVEIPEIMRLNYYESCLQNGVESRKVNDRIQYTWSYENYPAIEPESYSTSIWQNSPLVYVTTNHFELDGVRGKLDSWASLGQWLEVLQNEANNLPQHTIDEVRALVKDIPDTLGKIDAIYKYMQNKTRYVSIQIGIGGWKPFDAATVDQTGYGDCKALTNYMRSLLDAVGIPAYYTVVMAGSNAQPMITDFCMNQFNHAILCVPYKEDTLWLECTSQNNPFAFTGTFTDDRDVLVVGADGSGRIAHTSVYGLNDNLQNRISRVNVDAQGNATSSVKTEFKGLLYDKVSGYLQAQTDEIKQDLYHSLDLSNFTINRFDYSMVNEYEPCISEELDLTIDGFARKMGNRLFFSPNLLSQRASVPKMTDDRISDVIIRRSYMESDTIFYTLANGYIPEGIPEPKTIASDFGEYLCKSEFSDGTLVYTRTLKMFKGQHPAERYPELVAFLKDVYQADKEKVVFI
ncbi:MAG: DUF3857 domain-containing transglutaminase family protein, partial [Bacteroidota bacterium]